MKPLNGIFAATALLLLAGCSGALSPLSMVNRAQPVGSPYNKYLALEYRDLANRTSGSTADYFARKGLAAVDGLFVEPEDLTASNLRRADGGELVEARAQLMMLLNNGARDIAPDKAAMAQSHFDCWVAEEDPAPDDPGSCKDTFFAALSVLQNAAAIKPAPPMPPADSYTDFPGPVTDGARGGTVPLDQAAFLVFFDWDRYNISESAGDVVNMVAQEIKGRHDVRKVVIIGHTDTSGGEAYNHALSMKRANATKASLIKRGIPAAKIRVEGHGETDLLVKTQDNVREPQNRRAQITLE